MSNMLMQSIHSRSLAAVSDSADVELRDITSPFHSISDHADSSSSTQSMCPIADSCCHSIRSHEHVHSADSAEYYVKAENSYYCNMVLRSVSQLPPQPLDAKTIPSTG